MRLDEFWRLNHRDFPGNAVVKTVLLMQGAQVWSLVRELRSHMPPSVAKKKNLHYNFSFCAIETKVRL